MQYGNLTVLGQAGTNRHQKRLWKLRCACGKETVKVASSVKSGHTTSCGCAAKKGGNIRHGHRYHPLYATWCNMKARCDNANHPAYKNYGGRGITYDPSWTEFPSFLNDVGTPPFEKATLDRIDNDGHYCPENVRWADRVTQRRNSRQISAVEINGETKILTDWCKVYGITIGAIHRRLKKGEDLVSAITRPKAARFL
jgi:hypothetical protein